MVPGTDSQYRPIAAYMVLSYVEAEYSAASLAVMQTIIAASCCNRYSEEEHRKDKDDGCRHHLHQREQ